MSRESVENFIETITTSSEDLLLILAAIMTETTTRSDPIQDGGVYINRLYLNYELLRNEYWLTKQFRQVRE